ncbi:MAG: peptidoglycan DD-metalloendopeptidase family protein [Pseudomonadota bacterium]
MSLRQQKRSGVLRRSFPLGQSWSVFGSLVVTALAVMAMPSTAFAQADGQRASAADRAALLEKLKQNERELSDAARRENELQTTLGTLATERERLNRQLIDTAAAVQETEEALTKSETRLNDLEVREQVIRGSLFSQHARMARLLAAMQRMGRNPPPVIVTKRRDALSMVRSAMLLARAFPELQTEAQILRQQLQSLVDVTTNIKGERQKLREETIKLASAQAVLEEKLLEKRKVEDARQSELANVQAEARRIRQSGANLGELIAQLDTKIAEATALGEYNRRLKAERERQARLAVERERLRQAEDAARRAEESARRDAARQTQPRRQPQPDGAQPKRSTPPSVTPTTPPPTTGGRDFAARVPGQSLRPSPSGGGTRADRLTPAIPFVKAKGRLPTPVRGRTVLRYGDRTKLGRKSKGIVIETRSNARIVSPSDGWVVYAGPFRSYGQLLIINAGDGYHILLAGLSRIDVQLGHFVLASEPIGAMGSTPGTESGAGGPVLYVEFRKNSRPINPKPWWSRGRVVAQK